MKGGEKMHRKGFAVAIIITAIVAVSSSVAAIVLARIRHNMN